MTRLSRKHNPEYKGPISKFKHPELDIDDYHKLFDILYEDILGVNKSAMSRILGVSIPTVSRMDKQPPAGGKQWWWPMILRAIIFRYYSQMAQSTKKKHRQRAERLKEKVGRAGSSKMLEDLEIEDARADGCAQWLLAFLVQQPHNMVLFSHLRKQGVSGKYEDRTLRRAADRLCLIRERRGDDWSWRLPDMEDIK